MHGLELIVTRQDLTIDAHGPLREIGPLVLTRATQSTFPERATNVATARELQDRAAKAADDLPGEVTGILIPQDASTMSPTP